MQLGRELGHENQQPFFRVRRQRTQREQAMENILSLFGWWAAQKIADAVFAKILEKALSDENLKRWTSASKHQVLVFYFTYLLRTQPLRGSQKQTQNEEA